MLFTLFVPELDIYKYETLDDECDLYSTERFKLNNTRNTRHQTVGLLAVLRFGRL